MLYAFLDSLLIIKVFVNNVKMGVELVFQMNLVHVLFVGQVLHFMKVLLFNAPTLIVVIVIQIIELYALLVMMEILFLMGTVNLAQ